MSDERNKSSESIIRGVVEATNNKGIMIDGSWYNYSQYSRTPKPERGDEVEIKVSQGRWIRELEFVDHLSRAKEGDKKQYDRQLVITRLALLNTATSILAAQNKPFLYSDVVKGARALEWYVLGQARATGGMEESDLPDIPREIEDPPTPQPGMDGHDYHNSKLAESRVRSLFAMFGEYGFKERDAIINFIAHELDDKNVTCLHKWVMLGDNYKKITARFNEYVLAEEHGT